MKNTLCFIFILLAFLAGIHQAAAQGATAFTYQGQLRDNGTNANGTYTMIFALYDSPSGNDLIGGPLTNSATLVNGLFTVNLDFGAAAFNGGARYLDITITNGGTTQELSPRVQVLPSPYALYAATANVAASANFAAIATNVVSGINITNAIITNSIFAGNGWGLTNLQLTGTYTNAVTFNNTNNTFIGTFTGNGNGLTNIPASAILGGTNSNAMTFTNSTNTFVGTFIGNGDGLTNIPASGIVGLLYKQAVQEATTSNLPPYTYNNPAGTITGVPNVSLGQLQVDGITVSPGDSVLVKNDGADNGIYVCTINVSENNYTLTRRSDFITTNNLATGDMVSVVQGTVNANTTWFLTTTGPITIGTTPLTFALQLPASIFSTAAGLALANGVVTNSNIATNSVVKSLNGLMDNVALSAGNNLALFTNGNSLQISAFVPNVQLFVNTSATFTVPTNVTRIMVEMWGGGGGGGTGYYGAASGGSGNSNGGADNAFNGGGGGAGAYAWSVFTVTNGSSFTVTAPAKAGGGQNGGTASFSGNGISMTATGGSAGGTANASGPGIGGSGGSATGGLLNSEGGYGDYEGNGGGTWRGGSVTLFSGAFGSGPASGGIGGSAGYNGSSGFANPGEGGNSSIVIVYY